MVRCSPVVSSFHFSIWDGVGKADMNIEIDASMAQLQEKIEHQFDEFQTHAYCLAAVFIHRGKNGRFHVIP